MKDENLSIKKNEEFSTKNSLIFITCLIEKNKDNELLEYIRELHNADIADLLHNLEPESRLDFVNKIRSNFDPEILTYLNDSLRDEIIEVLDIKQLASNAKTLDVDDAVDLVEDFEKSDQTTFLENIEENERKLIVEGLNYPEDSAGRLMQRNFVGVDDSWNVATQMEKSQFTKYWGDIGSSDVVGNGEDPKFSKEWNEFKKYAFSKADAFWRSDQINYWRIFD